MQTSKTKGKIERVDGGVVKGWVSGSAAPELEIGIFVDDHIAGYARASLKSGDSASSKRPFDFRLPGQARDGRIHKLDLRLKGSPFELSLYPFVAVVERDHNAIENAAPPLALPSVVRPVIMPPGYEGHCDGVGNGYFYGWLRSTDANTPVALKFYIDDAEVAAGEASLFREDLLQAGLGDGRCAFHFNIPKTYRDGRPHIFDVRLSDAPDALLFPPVTQSLSMPEKVRRPILETLTEAMGEAPALLGRVEKIVRGKRRILVSGWLCALDGAPIRDEICLRLLGKRGVARIASLSYRGDLRKVGLAEGMAAFSAVFPLSANANLPDIIVQIEGQSSQRLTTQQAHIEHRSTIAHFESVSPLLVKGYVLDLDGPQSSADFRLAIGDLLECSVTLGCAEKPYIFTTDGPAAIHFSLPLRRAMQDLYARDSNFALTNSEPLQIALLSANSEILAVKAVNMSEAVRLRVEHHSANRVAGWMVNRDHQELYAEADIYVDGVRYGALMADRHRQDVISKGLTKRGGGFQFSATHLADGARSKELRFASRFTRNFIDNAPVVIPPYVRQSAPLRQIYGRVFAEGVLARRRVSIIVPVYNACEEVARCLKTLIQHTRDARIIVIDDASPDPDIQPMLKDFNGQGGVEVHTNIRNLGYTATINRGIDLAGDDDVIFLNSDTAVTIRWLDGLRLAAYSDSRIGTVTAVSNNAGAFSVPEAGLSNAIPQGFDYDDMARLVRQAGTGAYPRVPTGNGFCMYVRRDCIERVGKLDEKAFPRGYGEENDFCMRALHAGFQNIIDERTFIYHQRSASFLEEKRDLLSAGRSVVDSRYPEYSQLVRAQFQDDCLTAVRWRVRKALAQTGDRRPRPRILYVISTKTGGTPQTNRDLMRAVADRYEPWVLACDSQTLELFRYEDGAEQLIESVALGAPIHPTLHRSAEYDDAAAYLLLKYAIELTHIRHLGWHGANLPQICRQLDIPVVFSMHDFYTVCPSIKLLDQDNVHCGGSCTKTDGECSIELWRQKDFPHLKNGFVYRWRKIFAESFEACNAFVTTSSSARQLLLKAFPSLKMKDFHVIPHGRTFEEVGQFATEPTLDARLKILVPGNISPAKGSDLINAMLDLEQGDAIEWHILGDPGRVRKTKNVIIHGRYKRDEFAGKVAAISPHIGAVLSIWPETYCHTLTEMWASGVPVMGIDCGAVGERISAHGGGWLLPLGVTPEECLNALLRLRDKKEWGERVIEVQNWQNGYNREHTIWRMGGEYEEIYQTYLQSGAESASFNIGL